MKKSILLTISTGALFASLSVMASGPADSNGTVLKPNVETYNNGKGTKYTVSGGVVVGGKDPSRPVDSGSPGGPPEPSSPFAPPNPPAGNNDVTATTNSVATTNAPAATNATPEQNLTPSDQTPQPAEQAPPEPAVYTNNSTTVKLPNGDTGLIMNFRGVPLETVLQFMSDAAGFIIHPKVEVSGRVTAWSAKPLTKDEAVKLLKQVLAENGYTAIQDDRTLTIMRADEASKSDLIPVNISEDPTTIPAHSANIVTQIVPVHTLNVVQLINNLQKLVPATTMVADESANSVVITDTQGNIHRVVEIIRGLDSITTGNASIQVFPLKYADAKELASLLKDLFPAPEAAGPNGSSRGGGYSRFGRMMAAMSGGGGYPGGPPGDPNAAEGNGHTPTAKVNAVADDHSNSLIVTAPDEMMYSISNIVKDLDTPVDDATVAELFHLKNADANEMASILTQLFPDDNNQTDANRQTFSGLGYHSYFSGLSSRSTSSSANGTANESERMKRMAKVTAVADPRTSTLLVTAGTNVMTQIKTIIADLDARSDRHLSAHVIPLEYADPVDVETILQQLFPTTSGSPSSTSSALNSAQANPLLSRSQTLLQQQNSQNNVNSFGSGSRGGSTGAGF